MCCILCCRLCRLTLPVFPEVLRTLVAYRVAYYAGGGLETAGAAVETWRAHHCQHKRQLCSGKCHC